MAIDVQWGKHGSLPPGWRALSIVPGITEFVDAISQSLLPIPLPDSSEQPPRR